MAKYKKYSGTSMFDGSRIVPIRRTPYNENSNPAIVILKGIGYFFKLVWQKITPK